MKPVHAVVAAMFTVTVALFACSSEKKLGEACDTSGEDGECEDGAVCGKDVSGSLLCLKTCATQTDCAADQECNGVEGSSLKGCRAKTGSGTGTGTGGGTGTGTGGGDGGKK